MNRFPDSKSAMFDKAEFRGFFEFVSLLIFFIPIHILEYSWFFRLFQGFSYKTLKQSDAQTRDIHQKIHHKIPHRTVWNFWTRSGHWAWLSRNGLIPKTVQKWDLKIAWINSSDAYNSRTGLWSLNTWFENDNKFNLSIISTVILQATPSRYNIIPVCDTSASLDRL